MAEIYDSPTAPKADKASLKRPNDQFLSEVQIDIGRLSLGAFLNVPIAAKGLIIFAHGSGSSRHSPRNQFVAKLLFDAGLGTLLADLLSEEESAARRNVFNIELLSERLVSIAEWAAKNENLNHLPICFFGASTGAAAALQAAAKIPTLVNSIVSRGGRPDLAAHTLALVKAPTLLIIGAKDAEVLELNEQAMRRLRCENRLEIIPGASHLFEEPGALDLAAKLAIEWFETHLEHSQFNHVEHELLT
jgi:putative phosphoribosyl transferase